MHSLDDHQKMKKCYLLFALLGIIQAAAEVERLIDTPLTLEAFNQKKENLIGARVAIAGYFFGPFEGAWICSEKARPHKYKIRGKGGYEASYFTKEGKKVLGFGNELTDGYPCFVYGTVLRKNKSYYIQLESIYEVSSDDPDWLAAVRGDPDETGQSH